MTCPLLLLLNFEQNETFIEIMKIIVFPIKKKVIHSCYSETGVARFLLAV